MLVRNLECQILRYLDTQILRDLVIKKEQYKKKMKFKKLKLKS